MLFISFATEDQEVAEETVRYLEGLGARCWFAPRNAKPGEPYAQEIVDAIEQSRAIVLLLSRHASASKYVANEIERAENKNKPVFTLSIDGTKPAGSLEFFLSSRQWIDASTPPLGDHLRRVADALSLDTRAVAVPGRPASRRSRRALVAAAVAAVAIGVSIGGYVIIERARETRTCTLDVSFSDFDDGASPDYISVGNQQRAYQATGLRFPNVPAKKLVVSIGKEGDQLDSSRVQGCPADKLTVSLGGGKVGLEAR